MKWRRKRLFCVRGGTSKSIPSETKRQNHPKDYRDIRRIFSPYPLILCQITRLNGMKRLGVNALYRRAPHVLEGDQTSTQIRNCKLPVRIARLR
ncbi:hypothetical protein DTO013E5_6378 [Penicillium roqueforti]|uniref:uncharacterized protein n=1 Tax=Penicillium roqueforti TaxID=5082 RepID=UPI00190CD9C7|nr:uncharacterized protein LCP9604111_5346 [Penicillium roqueforti]KAF9248596.1 hypothetical protein LCP9604111_5346 [Penicillium roqueforti]KAI1832223.1 hypothetical protein CBS147337_6903 [Penicillium roqueforti]KAI2674191.1 hypothetical protein CBS147355_7366 [Penicillium roqueforti]KAI2682043.1 hypothetical protein LCP963914a_6458 [Penicillium roqueforti]KAI2699176.1 hypothetical protein CBS147372_6423 [Penicillium roqueforti]